MQLTELGSETLSILASTVSHGSSVAQGVATRILGDMVAERLARAGHSGAWQDFKRSPRNHSSAQDVLQQILQEDPEFRTRLEEALIAVMEENSRNSEQRSIHITGSGQAQIGDRGDTIKGSRVATRGSTYNEGAHITNKKSSASAPVALAMAALVIIGLAILLFKGVPALLHRMHDGGLTASSTCQQFLNADEQTEQQAIVDIAMSENVAGSGSPLALPAIRYYCSSEPSVTVGVVIGKFRGQF